MLDVTSFPGVDPTGLRDSTVGINQAIIQTRDARPSQTVFFPAGTYLVTDTIVGPHNGRGHSGQGAIVMVGSTKGPKRPLLKLKDGTPAFGNSNKPKPVVEILYIYNGREDAPMSFRDGFRGIDIDVGENNPGAVAIKFDAAQDCFLEDVTIQARDGFAGAIAIPGRNSTTANIEVVGGQYGLYLNRSGGSCGATLVGARFVQQTKMAMVLKQIRGLAITGFEILADKGPVIQVLGDVAEQTVCPMLDGSVDLAGGGEVVANPDKRFLGATDLYVRRANRLTKNIELPVAGGKWVRVKRFASCPEQVGKYRDNPVEAWNLVEGKRARDLVFDTEIVEQPPRDIAKRHVWSVTPSFEDQDVAVAPAPAESGDDSRDDTTMLQDLVNKNRKVFLPAGVYHVSRPLVLPAHHQLLGVPGLRSVLKPTSSWKPAQFTWVIDTQDDRDSSTVLMDIAMDTPDIDYLGGVRWRAGRNSIVRHVRAYLGSGRAATRLHNYQIEGGGGGRWYGQTDHAQLMPKAKADDHHYRKVMVQGTTEPLFFYGLNLERGGRSWGQPQNGPYLEIADSANVCVLGTKSETDGTVVRVLRSQNVLLMGMAAHRPEIKTGSFFVIQHSQDVGIMGGYWYGATSPLLTDDKGGDTIYRSQLLGLYLRGNPQPVYPSVSATRN